MGRREENKRHKRESLLAAGLSSMEHVGYDRASIEQIVRDAGVARGTFYLYYPDKLALFEDLVRPWVDALLALVAGTTEELRGATRDDALAVYQRMGLGIAVLGLTHRPVILLALRESRRPGDAGDFLRAQEGRILAAVTGMTELAVARGLIAVEDPALTVRVILGAAERLTFDVLTGVDVGDPLRVADQVVRLFTAAMGVGASAR